MKYVLGIDSGGTKFRVLACNLQGAELGSYTGDTTSHYYLPREEMLQRLNHHITECLQSFGGKRENCAFILVGSTGIDSDEDAEIVREVYQSLPGFACGVKVMNDVELAHQAVTGGKGALVISGTGSIAFGCSKAGKTARVGGWLFAIMGDEGSGNWVARHALRHLGRWFDGVVPDGPLASALRNQLGVETRKQLMDLSIQIATPPWAEPKLGPAVDDAAAAGDVYATEILRGAARETFGLVSSVITLLGLEEEGEYPVGIWGSNILHSPLHRRVFSELLAKHHPGAQLVTPTVSALQAAAKLALAAAQME